MRADRSENVEAKGEAPDGAESILQLLTSSVEVTELIHAEGEESITEIQSSMLSWFY